MKNKLIKLLFVITLLWSTVGYADEWDDIIKDAAKNRLSDSKKRTESGKRLIKEKSQRILELDAELPILLEHGDLKQAEQGQSEALRLTVELSDKKDDIKKIKDIRIPERLIKIGAVLARKGDLGGAMGVLEKSLKIGEPIVKEGSGRLASAYDLLARIYYESGDRKLSEKNATLALGAVLDAYGKDSPELELSKALMRKICRWEK
ncbi:MAG: hypothetical protein HQL30_10070 [Candidatus Omnitrophica bacterium]|nr:hypothetical protein [Candidatus Omnitrophota bacterium]